MSVVQSIQNFLGKNADIIKIVILVILVGVVAYFAKCNFKTENLYMEFAKYMKPEDGKYVDDIKNEGTDVEGAKTYKDMFYGAAPEMQKNTQEVNPEDLLPKTDLNNDLKNDANVLQGNFINAGLDYPIDTVGGSLKKLNYSLRSTPQIPVNRDISPFMVSSYEPDLYRKPLE